MMRDDELFELFQALDDDTPTEAPSYADDLWAELDEALTRQHSSGTKPPKADADVIEFRPRPNPRTTRFPMRGLVAAVGLAIAGLWVLFAMPFEQPDDVVTEAAQPPSLATTVDPTPTQPASSTSSVVQVPGPRLNVPSEACQRYATSQPTLADLAERATDGNLTAGDIEAATTALSMLQADLAASGEYTDADIRQIGSALEALKETSIEIEMGLDEQAAGSLSAASTSVDELLLPLGSGEDVAQLCLDADRG